jgi:hypothetical protein
MQLESQTDDRALAFIQFLHWMWGWYFGDEATVTVTRDRYPWRWICVHHKNWYWTSFRRGIPCEVELIQIQGNNSSLSLLFEPSCQSKFLDWHIQLFILFNIGPKTQWTQNIRRKNPFKRLPVLFNNVLFDFEFWFQISKLTDVDTVSCKLYYSFYSDDVMTIFCVHSSFSSYGKVKNFVRLFVVVIVWCDNETT